MNNDLSSFSFAIGSNRLNSNTHNALCYWVKEQWQSPWIDFITMDSTMKEKNTNKKDIKSYCNTVLLFLLLLLHRCSQENVFKSFFKNWKKTNNVIIYLLQFLNRPCSIHRCVLNFYSFSLCLCVCCSCHSFMCMAKTPEQTLKNWQYIKSNTINKMFLSLCLDVFCE